MVRWGDGAGEHGSGFFLFAGSAAQAVALELDTMSVVNDAVQYGVTERWICDDVMPLGHGHLTCDQERSLVVAIIDDLEQVTALVGGEWLGSPVVENDEIGAFERRHQTRMTAFATCLGEICEKARSSLIEDGKSVAAGLIPESAR